MVLPQEFTDVEQRKSLDIEEKCHRDDFARVASVLESIALDEVMLALLAAVTLSGHVLALGLTCLYHPIGLAVRALHSSPSVTPHLGQPLQNSLGKPKSQRFRGKPQIINTQERNIRVPVKGNFCPKCGGCGGGG